MEFVIIATVVLVLAMCLGADLVIVPIMFIVFLVVLLLVIFSFFVYSAVKLTGTKSVKGKFVRFGRAEGKKFDTAFYKVSDSEYPNVFPCEVECAQRYTYPIRSVGSDMTAKEMKFLT